MNQYFKKIYKKSASEFYIKVKDSLINENKMFIVTANPETLMIAEENEEFKKVLLDKKTIIIPDGIGIVKGANMLGVKIEERIPGVELSEKLLEWANDYKKSVYLFGSKEDVMEKMKKMIAVKYKNIILLGAQDGYVKDKEKVFENIEKSKPDLILVALGIPNQEFIIYNHLKNFDKGIFVGVGGTFDVLSGVKKRAPKLFISLHLEWLYRIMKEPKRFKRFYDSNIKYLAKIKDAKRALK